MARRWQALRSILRSGAGVALLALAPTLHAEDSPPAPANYFAGLVSSTLAYRPPGGPFAGLQKDLTPMAGYGRFVTSSLAVELDIGPTFIKGDYSSFSLMPGLVWAFDKNFYATVRFIVPVDPQMNLALAPGVGAIYPLAHGLSPFLEVNAVSYVGKGDPDFSASVTLGVLVSF